MPPRIDSTAVIAPPKIPTTNFGKITFDQFVSTSKDWDHINGHGQNILHHIILDKTRWNAGYFRALIDDQDLSEAQKDKLIELTKQPDDQNRLPAHYAAIKGDMQWLAELQYSKNLVKADIDNKSPIDYILDHNDPAMLKDFVDVCLDGDINANLGEGTTLAHCIAKHPNCRTFMKMLVLSTKTCDLNAKDRHGNTPLMLAAAVGRTENMDDILDAAADIATQELNSKRIHSALDRLGSKTPKKAREEIDKEGVRKDAQALLLTMVNLDGENAIHLLVEAKPDTDIAYIKHLAKLQAEIGSSIGIVDAEGNNIAHMLAASRSVLALQKLTESPEQRALLVARNKFGQTPLHILLTRPRSTNDYDEPTKEEERDRVFIDEVKKLFELAPEILATTRADENGNSLIHYVAAGGYHELMPLLLEKSVAIKLKNNDQQTPLHLAALNNHSKTVDSLLKFHQEKNKVNNKDKDGNTALHYAAMHGNIDMMRDLLLHGANPYLENTNKETVFDILDKYQGKTRTPEEEELRVEAYAILALHSGTNDLKRSQLKEADIAIGMIGKQFAVHLHNIVKNPPTTPSEFTDIIANITTGVLEERRALTSEEVTDFSHELSRTLKPIYDDMIKLDAAKNYTSTRDSWDLVGRLIDCVSNALVVARYTVWGLGSPEEKLLNAAKKVVSAELKEIPQGKFTKAPVDHEELLKHARSLRPAGVDVAHDDSTHILPVRKPSGHEKS